MLREIFFKKEEKLLSEQFSDEYRQYMSRTGRFMPKLG